MFDCVHELACRSEAVLVVAEIFSCKTSIRVGNEKVGYKSHKAGRHLHVSRGANSFHH